MFLGEWSAFSLLYEPFWTEKGWAWEMAWWMGVTEMRDRDWDQGVRDDVWEWREWG